MHSQSAMCGQETLLKGQEWSRGLPKESGVVGNGRGALPKG